MSNTPENTNLVMLFANLKQHMVVLLKKGANYFVLNPFLNWQSEPFADLKAAKTEFVRACFSYGIPENVKLNMVAVKGVYKQAKQQANNADDKTILQQVAHVFNTSNTNYAQPENEEKTAVNAGAEPIEKESIANDTTQ